MTLFQNGRLVLRDRIVSGSILVDNNGKISRIIKNKSIKKKYSKLVDLGGNYVIPGLVEVHGHMREPGMISKETIVSGTKAGIAGGYTTLIDMPNTIPPTITQELLDKKKKLYQNRSYMDYAFFIGADKLAVNELEKVNPKQVAGIKIFMAGHETTPAIVSDDKTLDKIFSIANKKKLLIALHAEDQRLIDYYWSKLPKLQKSRREKNSIWSTYLRQPIISIVAVARILALAERHEGLRIYILHTSTPEEIHLINHAKAQNKSVYSEVISYQLIFSVRDYRQLQNFIKVSPALRTIKTQKELWQLVRSEAIDVICSDHSPHEYKNKKLDCHLAPAGMPSLQEALPGLITAWIDRFGVKNIEEGLIKLSRMMSSNPARIFGFPSKGAIEVGKDADFSILDLTHPWRVSKNDLFTKVAWSAFEGKILYGRPISTYIKGQLIYQNGKIIHQPNGRWLHA